MKPYPAVGPYKARPSVIKADEPLTAEGLAEISAIYADSGTPNANTAHMHVVKLLELVNRLASVLPDRKPCNYFEHYAPGTHNMHVWKTYAGMGGWDHFLCEGQP